MTLGRSLRADELARPSPCTELLRVIEGSASTLVEFVDSHSVELRALMHHHGVLLLRGFADVTAESFGVAARGLLGELSEYPFFTGNYRSQMAPGVVASSSVAPQLPVVPHTEQSFNRRRPRTLGFCCLEPATAGGHTALHDMAAVWEHMPEAMAALLRWASIGKRTKALDERGRRNLFGDASLSQIETICAEYGADCMIDDGRVAIATRGPCVVRHPETGASCFCAFSSTIDAFYDFFGDPWLARYPGSSSTIRWLAKAPYPLFRLLVRRASAHFRSENLYFFEREGRPLELPRSLHRETNRLLWEHSLLWSWQRRDVIFLDNIRVGHARMPYVGAQRSLAAVVGPCYDADEPAYRVVDVARPRPRAAEADSSA